MSSPDTGSRKTAKPGTAKTAKIGKAAAKPAATKRARPVDSDGLTGEDKANFVKAMWEGVTPKGAKATGGTKTSGRSKPKEDGPKVEILRKISAPVREAARQTPESNDALALATTLENKFAAGELDMLTPESLQALMGALCKIYGANLENGNKFPILSGRGAVTGTDVMITCGALLKAVDLQVFELGMWQSWSGV